MPRLTRTEWLVLNSTSDDFESLEQIYRSVCLEFSAESYRPHDTGSYYWRESIDAVPLAEIADSLLMLTSRGCVSVRYADEHSGEQSFNDLSYTWRGWFHITDAGRAELAAQSY
jgi:hypothetical protein